MGTNIYVAIEQRQADGWKCIHAENEANIDWDPEVVTPLSTVSWQSYEVFGFLAGVRGRTVTNAIARKRGLPDDTTEAALNAMAPYADSSAGESGYGGWAHPAPAAATPNERAHADSERYGFSWVGLSELVEFDYDQVVTLKQGAPSTYRKELSRRFFENLEALKARVEHGEIRLLFCFDS